MLAEQLVDLGEQLRRELVGELNRLHVLVNLLNAAGACDHGAYPGVLQAPGDRKLSERRAD